MPNKTSESLLLMGGDIFDDNMDNSVEFSVAGKSKNKIALNEELNKIILSAINHGFSDIYITENSNMSFLSGGNIIKARDPSEGKKGNINKLGIKKAYISESDFNDFLKSIFHQESDLKKLNRVLDDKESFDYGIGFSLGEGRRDVRLRLMISNTLKGKKITIRPGMEEIIDSKIITDFGWMYNPDKDTPNYEEITEALEKNNGEIREKFKKMDRLNEHMKSDFNRKQGLIIVTGTTGEGKTTTNTSFLQELINQKPIHLATIEDPIEYIFNEGKGELTQLEIGTHLKSFSAGINATRRLNAQILYLQEIRDEETAQAVLDIIGAGTLVVTTLHTGSVSKTLKRLTGVMTSEKKDISFIQNFLADELISIVNQKFIMVNIGGILRKKVLLEYLHLGSGEKTLIREGNMSGIESKLMDEQPHTSIVKTAWYLYASRQIDVHQLFSTVASPASLDTLIKDEMDYIKVDDIVFFQEFLGRKNLGEDFNYEDNEEF